MVKNLPNTIYLHCSASDRDDDDSFYKIKLLHTGNTDTVLRWGKWGNVNCLAWNDIGYHTVILSDGAVYDGRPYDVIGAGIAGHNRDAIHICLSGENHFSDSQFKSLRRVLFNLMEAFPIITIDNIKGHNEMTDKKTCPNFSVDDFKKDFLIPIVGII